MQRHTNLCSLANTMLTFNSEDKHFHYEKKNSTKKSLVPIPKAPCTPSLITQSPPLSLVLSLTHLGRIDFTYNQRSLTTKTPYSHPNRFSNIRNKFFIP